MVEVTVRVEYKGKNYITNVITEKGTSTRKIMCIALDQIRKQWD